MELSKALSSSGIDPGKLEELIVVDSKMILGFLSNGQLPYKLWLELADKASLTGFFPVMIEGEKEGFLENLTLEIKRGESDERFRKRVGANAEEILARADLINVPRWFDQKWEWLKSNWKWINPELRRMKFFIKPQIQPKKTALEQYMPGLFGKTDRQVYSPSYFIMVPTKNSWEIPAYLRVGLATNWGYTPSDHCAVLKFWHRQYGSDLTDIRHETLNLFVRRPPRTNQAAIDLALQQFAYDPDLVQNIGGLRDVASAVHSAQLWQFWWD